MATLPSIALVPPLSQSRFEKMACPHLYQIAHVQRRPQLETPWAERGRQIHAGIAAYVAHLVETKAHTDYDWFREFVGAEAMGQEANEILEDFMNVFVLEHERVLGAEMYLSLDEEFRPANDAIDGFPLGDDDHAITPAYEGTLDLVELAGNKATITDWKSYFQIIDPDTFQAKLYPLLAFCHLPELEEVTFRLQFVRYGVGRDVKYRRAQDFERLKAAAIIARRRQLEMHRHRDDAWAAMPGAHCVYCPELAARKCPLNEANPWSLSVEERLRWQIYLDQASKANRQHLKDWINARGPIQCSDDNGKTFQAGFKLQERKRFPLLETLERVNAWMVNAGEDLRAKLFIGSTELKPLAKAKKRAALLHELEGIMVTKTQTKLVLSLVDEEEPDADADN